MKKTIFVVLALAGGQPVFADFLDPEAYRAVNLSIEVDGDGSTNLPIAVFGDTGGGLFDPPALAISESGDERGSASGSINHHSTISLGSTLLTASSTDTGFGTSAPAVGHRGTLVVASQFQLHFASDSPFTFTLTSTNLSHSSGSPGNAIDPVAYGVHLSNGATSILLAGYDLANPSGTTTLTVPAGSYVLAGLSGMGFDAVFGNPPAPSYNSSFNSTWTFTATTSIPAGLPLEYTDAEMTLAAEGTGVDLVNHNAIVHGVGADAESYERYRQWIAAGAAGLGGIYTSMGIVPGTDRPAVIAPVSNHQLQLSSFLGQSLSEENFDQLLLRYIYQGDVNLDGRVSDEDYLNIVANMGRAGSYFDGDADLDGAITPADMALVTANLGAGDNGEPRLAVMSEAAVPEPAGGGLIVAAACMWRRRRRT